VIKMVEHKDATDAERACRMCNSGLMAVKAKDLFALLNRVEPNNEAKEYYLTDIVNIANGTGGIVRSSPPIRSTWPGSTAGRNSR
jgi:bifunctional UDP-N-acetylglucosamine pyrophosphorylase/glucosamine-1-phosphate N-acetyltransferase